ncbi:hypothetical protein H6P81_017195 [Aristolochia fimbriata]|uniref:Uncharacterized protein n=1 Tax=Aristolochia fimbriata TaxID=158543 RepID=A0AAV7E0F2_ARIFI|nr:hypothetical protein H6P81_017195 [Aristolochia fimbriata]
MKVKFSMLSKKIFGACGGSSRSRRESPCTVDLREEYANAFRTESYNEFWARVLDLTGGNAASPNYTELTAAARLPSYRLFVEHLLDPDQPTVNRILALARTKYQSKNHSLISDYFSETAKASLLCGLLLKDIEQTRQHYLPLKTTLNLPENHLPDSFSDRLAEFARTLNPFDSSASSLSRFNSMQASCIGLLKRLEVGREKARVKLRLISRVKKALAIFLVAVTTTVAVVGVFLAAHTLVFVFLATPVLLLTPVRSISTRVRARVSAQLDAATKGTYILNRDLDTISRLVARLHNELDHAQAMVRFFLERCHERLEPGQEVLRQLRKIGSSFSQQLDDLEEHLYLCFMTINRARSLVMKEVLEPSHC